MSIKKNRSIENSYLLIFDGDDTLWETQELYERAKTKFANLIARLGYKKNQAIAQMDLIDSANVLEHGFSRRRFPLSLVQTYRKLAERAGAKVDKQLERELRVLGHAVYAKKPKLIPYALLTLRRLKKSFRLVLLTKGDTSVQRKRVAHSGLSDLFDAVYIVRNKSSDELRDVLRCEGVAPRDAVMIGDSVRSDIRPAIEIGMSAIWLRRKTWRYEKDSLPASRRLILVESLKKLPEILQNREQ